ncbi:MAG TPA: IS21 family transposase [Anaeromyxobacteraceae bacterium]|nr:IS21 family transposase [Anaeromyxobacteraceae bacterium]
MISPEMHAKIRRLFFAEHWRVGTIATELGVHHDAVRRAIEADRFIRPDALVRPSMLDPYKAFIAETLEQHPRLRATRLFEMVRDRGYRGSVVQLRRYVQEVRPGPRTEAFLRLATMPGEQAQVDWGHFGKIRVGHAERALSCFVMVLSWSRAIYARFTFDQTLESFLRCHREAFSALGGVPRSILYDNLKSVVLERAGDHVRFNESLLLCAGHYHFAPKPCAPYRGNEKGKVERTIQYLRHGFFAARRFTTIQDLNAQLAGWIERTANSRKVPGDPAGRVVRDAIEEERPRLLPLPEHPWGCDTIQSVSSGKQPYVRFDRNDYSIPHHLVGKPLTLVASETLVRITDSAGQVLASHARSYDQKQVIEAPEHVAELARAKRRAHELRGRDRVRASCPSADPFVEALALRGENLGGHVSRLLVLLARYGAADLEAAIKEALARGAVSAASVAHILDQRARARKVAPPLDVILPDDPRVRDLRVTPHSLETYDDLCQPKKVMP